MSGYGAPPAYGNGDAGRIVYVEGRPYAEINGTLKPIGGNPAPTMPQMAYPAYPAQPAMPVIIHNVLPSSGGTIINNNNNNNNNNSTAVSAAAAGAGAAGSGTLGGSNYDRGWDYNDPETCRMGLHNPHDYTETDGACCCPSYYNYIYCADCERWMYNDLTFREDKPEDGLAEDVIRFAKQRAGK